MVEFQAEGGGDFVRFKDYSELDAPEEAFMFDYPFAWDLLQYVEHIRGENRWFLKKCIELTSGRYSVDFVSYEVPEYKNFRLTVGVSPTAAGWDFSISYQNTELS